MAYFHDFIYRSNCKIWPALFQTFFFSKLVSNLDKKEGEKFNLSTEKAAAVASIFGWMNIFARGLGGFISDKMNSKYGTIVLEYI